MISRWTFLTSFAYWGAKQSRIFNSKKFGVWSENCYIVRYEAFVLYRNRTSYSSTSCLYRSVITSFSYRNKKLSFRSFFSSLSTLRNFRSWCSKYLDGRVFAHSLREFFENFKIWNCEILFHIRVRQRSSTFAKFQCSPTTLKFKIESIFASRLAAFSTSNY